MATVICRLILSPDVTSRQIDRLASDLRRTYCRPLTLRLRDLKGKRVRKQELLPISASAARIIDIEPSATFNVLSEAISESWGNGKALLRLADDEGMDVTVPSTDWLGDTFPSFDLHALLEPDQIPIPWNNEAIYVCPGNPEDVSSPKGMGAYVPKAR